eukprot:COSAG01_NODE_1180_length_11360_cov_40.643460_6_plen_119_part_00
MCSCPPHDCARPPGRSNAPASGTVTAINVAAGDSVQRGAVLVAITKGDNDAEAVAEQRASLDNIRADLAAVRENVIPRCHSLSHSPPAGAEISVPAAQTDRMGVHMCRSSYARATRKT